MARWRRSGAGCWPSYLALYDRSLRAFAGDVDAARIPVDLIGGEVIVTAGGDDQVWPSTAFGAKSLDLF